MNRLFLCLVLALVAFFPMSCLKSNGSSCTPVSAKDDEPKLLAYATANGITPTKHPSGLYYQIIDPGTGATPGAGSRIKVKYTGRFADNAIFDKMDTPSAEGWVLNSLIEGWQVGIPLISKGGKIKLLIPSAMAYGCGGVSGAIPSNAVLFFDIELVDVQ